MNQIKMGIIGAGNWGATHACIYKEHPNAKVCAICDMDIHKAHAIASKVGIDDVYSDYHEMLHKADIDAVAIVTPDFLHADITVAAANAKKHMIIEKPLATTTDDVLRMVEAIERNNVRAMVDLHNRWNPTFHIAKQQIKTGMLGKPVSAYMRLNDIKWVATDMLPWAAKSSIIWFLGSHALDTLRWMFDDEPEEIYAVESKGVLQGLGIDTTDVYQTTIKFRKGGIAQMENGWITPNGNGCINDFKCNMVLEHGKVDIDASSHHMIEISTDEKVYVPDVLVKHSVFDKCKGFAFESIRSFVDQMVSGEEFHVMLRDAANTSLALLAVFESCKSGLPVKVMGLYD